MQIKGIVQLNQKQENEVIYYCILIPYRLENLFTKYIHSFRKKAIMDIQPKRESHIKEPAQAERSARLQVAGKLS